jgi:hypothetical protein
MEFFLTHFMSTEIHPLFGGRGVFLDRVSLYSPGLPGTHFVDQAGLELRNPPASASQVLGLKVCAITTWPDCFHFNFISIKYIYQIYLCKNKDTISVIIIRKMLH